MIQLRCGHCQILVQVEDAPAGSIVSCPQCGGLLSIPRRDENDSYQVAEEPAPTKKSSEAKKLVRHLEKEADRRASEPPYHQSKPMTRYLVGGVLIFVGVAAFLQGFSGSQGMMGGLVNGVLFSMIFFILGAGCFLVEL